MDDVILVADDKTSLNRLLEQALVTGQSLNLKWSSTKSHIEIRHFNRKTPTRDTQGIKLGEAVLHSVKKGVLIYMGCELTWKVTDRNANKRAKNDHMIKLARIKRRQVRATGWAIRHLIRAVTIPSLQWININFVLSEKTLVKMARNAAACFKVKLNITRDVRPHMLWNPAELGGWSLPNALDECKKSFVIRYLDCLNSVDKVVKDSTRARLAHEMRYFEGYEAASAKLDECVSDEHKFMVLLKETDLHLWSPGIRINGP